MSAVTDTLIDISPVLSARIGVWPGDTPLSRTVMCDMQDGDNLTLSSLMTTVHVGAHADAPNHYGKDAPGIDAAKLERYIGRCQVVRATVQRGQRIALSMLEQPVEAERVLIYSGTFADHENWNTDFAALEPSLVEALADRGVKLIGIDTPSVDVFDSEDLPAHNALLRRDVSVLEGIVLGAVQPGFYELIALPLKLEGFDASPVRAVLRAL